MVSVPPLDSTRSPLAKRGDNDKALSGGNRVSGPLEGFRCQTGPSHRNGIHNTGVVPFSVLWWLYIITAVGWLQLRARQVHIGHSNVNMETRIDDENRTVMPIWLASIIFYSASISHESSLVFTHSVRIPKGMGNSFT